MRKILWLIMFLSLMGGSFLSAQSTCPAPLPEPYFCDDFDSISTTTPLPVAHLVMSNPDVQNKHYWDSIGPPDVAINFPGGTGLYVTRVGTNGIAHEVPWISDLCTNADPIPPGCPSYPGNRRSCSNTYKNFILGTALKTYTSTGWIRVPKQGADNTKWLRWYTQELAPAPITTAGYNMNGLVNGAPDGSAFAAHHAKIEIPVLNCTPTPDPTMLDPKDLILDSTPLDTFKRFVVTITVGNVPGSTTRRRVTLTSQVLNLDGTSTPDLCDVRDRTRCSYITWLDDVDGGTACATNLLSQKYQIRLYPVVDGRAPANTRIFELDKIELKCSSCP